jgi:hypothetical protein
MIVFCEGCEMLLSFEMPPYISVILRGLARRFQGYLVPSIFIKFLSVPSLHLPSIRPRHSLCCSADQLSWQSKVSTCIWVLQRVSSFVAFTNTLRNHSCKWTRHDTRRTTVQTRRVYDRLQLWRWWRYPLDTEIKQFSIHSLAYFARRNTRPNTVLYVQIR